MKRSDKIMSAVIDLTNQFDPQHPEMSLSRLHVTSIAAASGISPNNASMELSRLCRDGLLVRVGGRPVSYLSPVHLEELLNRKLPTRYFENSTVFLETLFSRQRMEDRPALARSNAGCASAFDQLIGAQHSLKESIEQAKAAVLYPPNGLHTLITGPTGSGKSLFAKCMYDYAVKSGMLKQGVALVTFNCANYSDNPQLLLSQLFGYAKGAFTGAASDHPGLVESADNGILFLDEIHRLTPEGQEKLFLLLDQGVFRRMGETSKERHVQLQLIGATTESPIECMLSTFLRRIPAHVVLPSLGERPVRERMILVLYFLWREAGQLGQRIYLGEDILSALVHYDCLANVGQLENDIRLTCANVYYQFMLCRTDVCQIRLSDLTANIQQGLMSSRDTSTFLVRENLSSARGQQLVIDGHISFQQILNAYLHQID